jgi:hypothetical protein
VQTEEMGILSEIGVDVSWEQQGYYYFDIGSDLLGRFNHASNNGNDMWKLDIAALMMNRDSDGYETWDTQYFIYEALGNSDLAKMLGFKKLFVEHMLNGDTKRYAEISEEFYERLRELNHWGYHAFGTVYQQIINDFNLPFGIRNPYPDFTHALAGAVRKKIKFAEEQQLIAECRAHLTSYDDFIYGLKVNQALHERLEQAHGARLASLQSSYDERLKLLYAAAERIGLTDALAKEIKLIGGETFNVESSIKLLLETKMNPMAPTDD